MSKNSLKAIPIVAIDSATFVAGTYVPFCTGLEQACGIVRIINNCSEDIFLSYDGINDNDFIQAGWEYYLYAQMNAQPTSNVALAPKGMKIYIKANAGIGNCYLIGYYQES